MVGKSPRRLRLAGFSFAASRRRQILLEGLGRDAAGLASRSRLEVLDEGQGRPTTAPAGMPP